MLLDGMEPEKRKKALGDALKESMRRDSVRGMRWALRNGASLAHGRPRRGWLEECAQNSVSPRALAELGRLGVLEEEISAWESDGWSAVMAALRWSQWLGFEDSAREAAEVIRRFGGAAPREREDRIELARLKMEEVSGAGDFASWAGISLAEFEEEGREMAIGALDSFLLRGGMRPEAQRWPEWAEDLSGAWGEAFKPKSAGEALLEAVADRLESGIGEWGGGSWAAGERAHALAEKGRLEGLLGGDLGGVQPEALRRMKGRVASVLAAGESSGRPSEGPRGFLAADDEERREGARALLDALDRAIPEPARKPRVL